ncbi:sister chromatid cohesion and DNA repair protein [Patellaria atrata CBS 101060]|uniref:Sister chromatid cohesion and DNA repair protein n=1 Tax=Patellaria atrata CBS 101060 TaxID=1346257 RepID=A0A9P4S7R5_9PEZI|nr:sister chromatid cohesion and DNA repair protein [Patellaria atrata CBS 101060]
MPGTRSRRSNAAAQVIQQDDMEEEEQRTSLQFHEPLTWRAGKPIPLGELLRRLETLSIELRELEQEEADRESLLPVAKQLASQNLVLHKDRGVRAWTACCVVDMFRLCAPDAPYTASQLTDLFTLFIQTIFPALSDPSNPYNGQHQYVLKSLADVKSIVLLTDLPSASNKLILQLFTMCFDVLSGPSKAVSGEELSKNVEHHMTSVLATLVDECPNLPPQVVDIILAQFLRADPRVLSAGGTKSKKVDQLEQNQSTLLLKEAPPAYNMAKNICNSCSDKMGRHISQYFSSVIMDASSFSGPNNPKSRTHRKGSISDDSEDEGAHGPSEEDLHEIEKAHRMLKELWRSSPAVLQEIIPQLEAEVNVTDVRLRSLATETLGDMIAGIGAAGPPPPAVLDPGAFPSQSLSPPSSGLKVYNFLTTPTSPHSFPTRHAEAYHTFLQRRKDKSPVIRALWTTAIGRILMTSAGGVGLDSEEEQKLLRYFADTLLDSDEKVRLAAVQAIERFEFHDIVQKLGSIGGVSDTGSILNNLAERVKDRKHSVRTEAIELLGKVWGVGYGAIAEENERITNLLGAVPSKILETYYINDKELMALADYVLFESLLPMAYPPVKPKAPQTTNGTSQKSKGYQSKDEGVYSESDIDKIRANRVLIIIRDLESKARTVLLAQKGKNQVMQAKFTEAYLKKCEEYNGGVMDKGEKEIKAQLGKLIELLSKSLPDPSKASDDLWKFAKGHDRRSYQLIRFAMATDSDHRKVHRAVREVFNKLQDDSKMQVLDTLRPLIYRSSVVLYNKSLVPAIIEYSRTDEGGLGTVAHEVLKEISAHNPEVFKAHINELARAIEKDAPTAKKMNSANAVDDLKACAGFARAFPKDVPKDRQFTQSMINFALYGTPPKAAKYAISVLMAITDKKELHSQRIFRECTNDFSYGSDFYLTKLASLSQLMLLCAGELEGEVEAAFGIAINEVLLHNPDPVDGPNPVWTDELDPHCEAKTWALKMLVNRLRAYGNIEMIKEVAEPVYKLLNKLIAKKGVLTEKVDLPEAQKSKMRLQAYLLHLKLCSNKRFDPLLSHQAFNRLATAAVHDPVEVVRQTFINKLMKYLGQNKLPIRFYSIIFMMAFEPDPRLKNSVTTWIKARAAAFAQKKDTSMETIFARFLSVLAHHPDFDLEPENLQDFAQYIIFYLKSIAKEENMPLILHVAQRVKGVRDGIDPQKSENLYALSDLAQGVIRRYEEIHGWSIQIWPGKIRLPAGIFATLPSHDAAQAIADKQYLPEEFVEQLDDLVKSSLRFKKRKSDVLGNNRAAKRVKPIGPASLKMKSLPIRKPSKSARTPKAKRIREEEAPSSDRRRSGRHAVQKSYAEQSDTEDDGEMEMSNEGANQKEDEPSEQSEAEGDEPSEQSEAEDEAGEEVEEEPEPEERKRPRSTRKSNGVQKSNGLARNKKREREIVPISSDHSSDEELSDPPGSDGE